ncbi:tRNA (adenosine(37)-N6)-threonylcarbamoyltransferase complex ATPase subunit type 1 TsaE [bacterium]|nr:tRNA (adenosine(37)-N6)-threonylcarbamoyltransferase complex ATPase subunit type 1 TsaE [bacterium]
MVSFEYITNSPKQTGNLGKKIGAVLKQGDVLALSGDLGTGKTCLSQGIACGLGVDSNVPVSSPTYTLVNQYEGKILVFHLDLYRIKSDDEFYLSGLDEFLSGNAVTIIEWADKHVDVMPAEAVWINLSFIDFKTRKILITYNEDYHEKKLFSFGN